MDTGLASLLDESLQAAEPPASPELESPEKEPVPVESGAPAEDPLPEA